METAISISSFKSGYILRTLACRCALNPKPEPPNRTLPYLKPRSPVGSGAVSAKGLECRGLGLSGLEFRTQGLGTRIVLSWVLG